MMLTLPSTQRFYHYFLLVISIFVISCKKEASIAYTPPPEQSTSPFIKELYTEWIGYIEEHPNEASLKPNEKLDWQKIVLRISSDAKRSINYYVPILNDNKPCNKALELSFSTEKRISQAAVRTYSAPSDTAANSSEARRLQTVLYNLSAMGLVIPQTVIDREQTIRKELKQKNIASAKNQNTSQEMKDSPSTSIAKSTRSCETLVNFDFYYSFYGYTWNEYSVYINNVQIANYFRNEVFSYMKYAMNLDYETPLSAQQNTMTFYNIQNNNELGDWIHIALDHAAGTTQTYYSLAYSHVDYYYYDVLYSTCGISSGGGGGSGSNYAEEPGSSYEVESFDNGIDLNQKLNCFNNVPDNSNTIYTAKICADLPDNSNPRALIGPDRVGHSFITLTKSNGGNTITQTFGFYPKKGYKSISGVYVDSQIEDDGATQHQYNASYTADLNQLDFERAIKAAKDYSSLKYNLKEFNCTDYALNVFNAGLSSNAQISVPDWVPSTYNYGTTPTGLYQKIKELKDAGKSGAATTTTNAPPSSSCN